MGLWGSTTWAAACSGFAFLATRLPSPVSFDSLGDLKSATSIYRTRVHCHGSTWLPQSCFIGMAMQAYGNGCAWTTQTGWRLVERFLTVSCFKKNQRSMGIGQNQGTQTIECWERNGYNIYIHYIYNIEIYGAADGLVYQGAMNWFKVAHLRQASSGHFPPATLRHQRVT